MTAVRPHYISALTASRLLFNPPPTHHSNGFASRATSSSETTLSAESEALNRGGDLKLGELPKKTGTWKQPISHRRQIKKVPQNIHYAAKTGVTHYLDLEMDYRTAPSVARPLRFSSFRVSYGVEGVKPRGREFLAEKPLGSQPAFGCSRVTVSFG